MPSEFILGKTIEGHDFSVDRDKFIKHAVILGATGSGKTVLSKAIIEDAALAGIPVVVLDPKGDMTTLALACYESFRPWCDAEARARGLDPEVYDHELLREYSKKLRQYNLDLINVKEFSENIRVKIYTPRSNLGIPLSISPSFDPPYNYDTLLKEDPSSAYELLESTALSILRLIGYSEKRRRELALLSSIINEKWARGEGISIEQLIEEVRNPSISKMGSLNIDEFISSKERKKLARDLNLLISYPSFKAWFFGEKLDMDRLFEPKTISVIDLRWIPTESEKHFFVGILLNCLYSWMLKKEGTNRLKYLLVFDEVVGYVPPVQAPPSKRALLMLIKQARAFGLGIILATQNPVDVDYKVLSNAANRFIGRLATKQDIAKVRSGLELDNSGGILAKLKTLEFLYHNYDEGKTVLIRPRWLLTYHRGALTADEIKLVCAKYKREIKLPEYKPPRDTEVKQKTYIPLGKYDILSVKSSTVSRWIANVEEIVVADIPPIGKIEKKLKRKIRVVIHPLVPDYMVIFIDEKPFKVTKKKELTRSVIRKLLEDIVLEKIVYSDVVKIASVSPDNEKELAEKVKEKILLKMEKELRRLESRINHYKYNVIPRKNMIISELAKLEKEIERIEEKIGKRGRRQRLSLIEHKGYSRKYLLELKKHRRTLKRKLAQILEAEEMVSRYPILADNIRRKYEPYLKRPLNYIFIRPIFKINNIKFEKGKGSLMKVSRHGLKSTVFIEKKRGYIYAGRCIVCGIPVVTGSRRIPLCSECFSPVCDNHTISCYICGETVCKMHAYKCSECGKTTCRDCCVEKRFLFKKKYVCLNCIEKLTK